MMTKKEIVLKPLVKVGVGVVFGVGKVAVLIPITRKKIYKVMRTAAKTDRDDDFKDTLFTKPMYKTLVKQILMDISKPLQIKSVIPNLPLYKMDQDLPTTTRKTYLHNIQRKGVPLVISFGSCS
ncbi:uncharacterized protein LOC130641090 [Hydractinia symbiolongicarpus]|uniref:uncharacterized protein LOC130641090 n=1 Tax=Hydractinia symbiolongicarpus TaxID=13093 RepID=UPI00254FFE13|nr:uncharacterized protein LOC130641090 [Hydractinia symbiolongicarpus]